MEGPPCPSPSASPSASCSASGLTSAQSPGRSPLGRATGRSAPGRRPGASPPPWICPDRSATEAPGVSAASKAPTTNGWAPPHWNCGGAQPRSRLLGNVAAKLAGANPHYDAPLVDLRLERRGGRPGRPVVVAATSTGDDRQAAGFGSGALVHSLGIHAETVTRNLRPVRSGFPRCVQAGCSTSAGRSAMAARASHRPRPNTSEGAPRGCSPSNSQRRIRSAVASASESASTVKTVAMRPL